MTTQTFTLVLAIPSGVVNANDRGHWRPRADATRAIRAAAWGAATRQGFTPMQRARLVTTIGWPDKRRRDVSNLSPTFKAAIDGFVDAGLIPDDDDTHLTIGDLLPYVEGERGVVTIDFRFTEVAL